MNSNNHLIDARSDSRERCFLEPYGRQDFRQPSPSIVFPTHPLHPEPRVGWPMPARPDYSALRRASAIFPMDIATLAKEVEFPPTSIQPSTWLPQFNRRPRLDYPGQDAIRDYETTLHGLAQYARNYNVLPTAGQLLQLYLDGTGEPVTIDAATLLGHAQVQDAERQNLSRFVQSLVGNINDYRFSQPMVLGNINKLNALRDGEEANLQDEWSSSFGSGDYSVDLAKMLRRDWRFRDTEGRHGVPIGGENWHDLLLSLGKSNVKSIGALRVKRLGDQLNVSGMIDHGVNGRYDYELDQPMGLGGLAMEQYGFAKSFPIRSNWRTYLEGTVGLHGGQRVNPQIRIYRESELPRREE